MRRGRITSAVWLLGAAVALGAQSPATSAAQSSGSEIVTHTLRVSRFHTLSDFTKDRAEAIVEEMGRVLQTDDGGANAAPDVDCAVEFSLGGQVDEFTVGSGVIYNEADFREVITSAPLGTVKVVLAIEWCKVPTDGSFIGGCADIEAGSFVVSSGLKKTDLAGALWSHEFGHLQGFLTEWTNRSWS